MVVWLRPEYILAFITSLYYCSQLVLSKTYDKFWCATEEGHHQLSCSDETALLTDISIRKVYRRTQMCEPDDHSDLLVHCQSYINSSLCEGNKTCSIEISSRDYIQCEDKIYTPTYFFVEYTCIQIHTMCIDKLPIRNTLYGYIVSPAYPHPMADNLKCSITIEADPSMYIELSPIQIYLQDAIKCHSEYIEIFGYDSSIDENNNDKNSIWKAYYTWCGAERSLNNPLPNARYLISSNSLYISLQTTTSKKPRYFKIRYKIVPSKARSKYNSDGIDFDSSGKGHLMTLISSSTVIPRTSIIPSINNSDVKNLNGTLIKRTYKKEILVGIIAGVIVLLISIIVGILIFIFIKRHRSSHSSNTGKKNAPSTTSNITSKSTAKSSDKAPLLEQTNNTSTATATKRKLVPERTVQISDVSISRFKSSETSGTKTDSTKPEISTSKPTLTAADSGIYGADLTEDNTITSKPISPSASDPPKIYSPDLSNVSEPIPTIVINPLNENSTISAIIPSDNIETNSSSIIENKEKETSLDNDYSHLINATTSENEGTINDNTLQSRRTSNIKQSLVIQESDNIETIIISEDIESSSSHNTIPFNPLHVILKKDANKYYTTEYI